MRRWKRTAAAMGGAALVAASGACGLAGGDDSGEGADEAVDAEAAVDLAQLINETRISERELNNAENRIIAECLEDQGFLVHDKWTLMDLDTEASSTESLSGFSPNSEWLPDLETAQQWGFGLWAESEEADSSEVEAYYGEGDESGDKRDNTEFEALSNDERRDWYYAYGGEEWANQRYAGNFLTQSELQDLIESTGSEGGKIDLGNPPPGGCLGEMIAALYGEPELVEHTDDGGTTESWEWRPQAPVGEEDLDYDQMQTDWHDRLFDAEGAMVDCLTERGHEGWQFDEYGGLPVWPYWRTVYHGSSEEDEGAGAEVPPPAADLPDDFEGRKAAEIAMAVDFAECAESSGYQAAAVSVWDELHFEVYSEVEVELYAWQEGVDAALAEAQDMIAA